MEPAVNDIAESENTSPTKSQQEKLEEDQPKVEQLEPQKETVANSLVSKELKHATPSSEEVKKPIAASPKPNITSPSPGLLCYLFALTLIVVIDVS